MARGSFVCNTSIVVLWLGTEGGVWLGFFFLECSSIVGLWLGSEVSLWLEILLFVMLV